MPSRSTEASSLGVKMKLLIVACLSVFAVASPSLRYLRDTESSDAPQGHVKGLARVTPDIGLDSDEDAYDYPDSTRRLLESFRRVTPGFGFKSKEDESRPAEHFRQLLDGPRRRVPPGLNSDEEAIDYSDSARRLLESFRRVTPGFGFKSKEDESRPAEHFRQLLDGPRRRVPPGLNSDEEAIDYSDSARRLLENFRRVTPGFGFKSKEDESRPAEHFRQLLDGPRRRVPPGLNSDEEAIDYSDSARRLLESFRRVTPGFGSKSKEDESRPAELARQLLDGPRRRVTPSIETEDN
ncbi:hypothetical protein AC1031_017399 [Aphanomyces cochlioides]|nr:hypothetical protein AC1031_017399 [Aphanomyces cochlioides]